MYYPTSFRIAVAALAFFLFSSGSSALAQDGRVQALGGMGLFTEDASNVFTNPSLAGVHSNRVFFSLGLSGNGQALGIEPHGGGFVTLKDTFNETNVISHTLHQ